MLEVQGFFERAGPNSASVTTGLAIDYPAIPNVPLIQISMAQNATKGAATTYLINNACSAHILLDGVLQQASRGKHIANTGSYAMMLSPTGGVDIQFFNTSTKPPTPITSIRVRVEESPTGTWGCMMNIQVCLPLNQPELRSKTIGLLGTPNGNRTDEWTTPSQQVLPIVPTGPGSYSYCTNNHCVRNEVDSLFVHCANGVTNFRDVYSCISTFPGEPDVSLAPPAIVAICGIEDADCLMEGMLGGPEEAVRNLEQQELIAEIIATPVLTPEGKFNITVVHVPMPQ